MNTTSTSKTLLFLTGLLLFNFSLGCNSQINSAPPYWKGNTHTHTLWSDGNAAPEIIVDYYRTHGYQFLVLSDHNILSDHDKWFPVKTDDSGRLKRAHLEEIKTKFGPDWVKTKPPSNERDLILMKLKTLAELRPRFESPGEFIFIQGEEITDRFENHPVHVNGINLNELIKPSGGSSVREVMQRNIDAVIAQSKKFHQPMLAHINHPNYQWGLTPDDVASIRGERFFEVYNGHSAVRNYGDENHPSMEALWDQALTYRLTDPEHNLGLLYGVATDDSHDYYNWGLGKTNPGRGWVMVQAPTLNANAIIEAMRAGQFYASSGVTLLQINTDSRSYTIEINPEPETTYTTQFIGTRTDNPDDIGIVLYETTANPAVYEFAGNELYIRAQIVSSKLHPNPYAKDDHETAWAQPVIPGNIYK